jgi:hypothetical protein
VFFLKNIVDILPARLESFITNSDAPMKALHLSVLSPRRCTPQRQRFSILFFLSPQTLTQVDQQNLRSTKTFPQQYHEQK